MKLKLPIIFVFFFTLLLGLSLPKDALADTVTLSGNVSNSVGTNLDGASVTVTDTNTNSTVGSTTTDSSGNYNLIVSSGTYNVQVTPPAGSNFSPAVALSQTISSNTVLNFILTPAGIVNLSGHIQDSLGNPLSNQKIQLIASGNVNETTSDISGNYSLQVSSGMYTLVLTADNNSATLNVPQHYKLISSGYSLTQSTMVDFTVPSKKVDIHVQDSSSNSVSNVTVNASIPNGLIQNISIGGGIMAAGESSYGITTNSSAITNSSGDTTMWLLSTDANTVYNFTATPPSGSNFQPTTLSNISITNDTQQTITLPQPITFSGHIYDPQGNPVGNQKIQLISSGNINETTTDNSGNYSLQTSPGTYTLVLTADTNPSTVNLSQHYKLISSGYSLTQNTIADFTIPVKKVTVHIRDGFDDPVNNVGVKASIPNGLIQNVSIGNTIFAGESSYGTTATEPRTDGSGNVDLWLLATDANTTYNLTAVPPNASNYQLTTLSNVTFTTDTQKTIVLLQPVTLSGHVYDPLGNPLSDQTVSLSQPGIPNSLITTTTDAQGQYSLQASAASYTLAVRADNNSSLINAPQHYQLISSDYSLSQTTTADLTIPAKKVIMHVQDTLGNPVTNVEIKASIPNGLIQNITIGNTILAAGESSYGVTAATNAKTNASGDAILWLLPTDTNTVYNFIATPPSGSIYSSFALNNISVTEDQTELISLQYNHNTPVTTVDLATQHPDGTYSNPTTVTLTASAAAGYSIANTYYKVDGGSQQTYTDPFTVTGNGEHTIEYWSVDNSGVQEAHKTKTFTIYTNQAPVVDPFSGATIDRGQTFTASSFFTDPDSTSWTATVDYDDGAGEEPLPLNPDKTFTLSHQYNAAGEYTVTVVVRDDGQSTGTTMATVTVVILDPVTTTFTSSADTYVKSGQDNRNTGAGVFMRLASSGDNRSLVRFNQSAMQSEIGNKQVLSAKLRVTITDNSNNWGATGRTIDVHRLIADWTEGDGTEVDRGTGAGATWNCATDSIIENQAKNCSGTTEWEMGQPNNPSVHPWIQTATATQTIINNQSGVVEFDVTTDVANFLNGTNSNYGWILKKTNEGQNGQVSFGTKESSSDPQLVVIYQP